MHLRLPQGYLAAGDTCTRRYDEVIKDIPRKVKIIDDTFYMTITLTEHFSHMGLPHNEF